MATYIIKSADLQTIGTIYPNKSITLQSGQNRPSRSTIVDSTNRTYNIQTIGLSGVKANTFHIIVTYSIPYHLRGTTPSITTIYVNIPVKLGNYSNTYTNTEFTQFITNINGSNDATNSNITMNLAELYGSLPEDYTVSSIPNDAYGLLITYGEIYINQTTTPNKTLNDGLINILDFSKSESAIVTIEKTADTTVSCKRNAEYNKDSRDPTRTIRIDTYNPDRLTIYTGLMITAIVIGFIIVTAYVVIVLIPDSRLHIIKPRGGGDVWSIIRNPFTNIFRRW